MTKSERTITVRLTGPQYQALASAVALLGAEYSNGDRDWEPGYSQKAGALDRAWRKIRSAWERNDQTPTVPASVARMRNQHFPQSPNVR